MKLRTGLLLLSFFLLSVSPVRLLADEAKEAPSEEARLMSDRKDEQGPFNDVAPAEQAQLAKMEEAEPAPAPPRVKLDKPTLEAGDFIEADSAVYTGDGLWRLTGNVLISLSSLIEGSTVLIKAEDISYQEAGQTFESSGVVKFELPELGIHLEGSNLFLNGRSRKGKLDSIKGSTKFDLDFLLDETGLRNYQYFRVPIGKDPALVLRNGRLEITENAQGALAFLFRGVELSTSATDNPDFIIKAQEITYNPELPVKFSAFRNFRVTASGVSVFYFPKFKRTGAGALGLGGETLILPGKDIQDGLYLSYLNLNDFGNFHADIYGRYYPKIGLWPEGFFYVDLSETATAGFHIGKRRSRDLFNNRVGETALFEIYANYLQREPLPILKSLDVSVSFGKFKQDIPNIKSERIFLFAEATSKPFEIGNGTRGVVASSVTYYDYDYADLEFLAFRHRVKIAHETPWGLDFVEFRHADKFGSSPFRFDDNFAENELFFQKNFVPIHGTSARVFGKYNYELERFDTLAVGLSKEFRSYYGGLYYDFARGSTGLEFALKF